MNTIAQIFPRTGRISGPEEADGAKPDVPTTDVENEKKKKHPVFYEAVDAHARHHLNTGNRYELIINVSIRSQMRPADECGTG